MKLRSHIAFVIAVAAITFSAVGTWFAIAAAPPAPATSQTAESASQPSTTADPVPSDDQFTAAYPGIGPDELALRKALSRRLHPLVQLDIAAAQREILRKAVDAADAGKSESAGELAAQLEEPAARKIVEWRLLASGTGSAAAIWTFLDNNPMWPDRATLQRRFEQALLRDGGTARQIRGYFTKSPPQYGAGVAALASAELALGNNEKAAEFAAAAWCHYRLAESIEDDFLRRFGSMLTRQHHRCRVDRLLVSSPRAKSVRHSRAAAATRLLEFFEADERQKIAARIAIYKGDDRKGLRLLRDILRTPARVEKDWGLAYQRIVRSRQRKDYVHARKLLKTVPAEDPSLVNRDSWWEERHRNAIAALRNPRGAIEAYRIVSGARPRDVNLAKEQAFFAGWIALEKLKRPKLAEPHFARLVELADGPLSRSTAHYWHGRALRRLDRRPEAQAAFERAAEVRDTFHGLLAQRAATPQARSIQLPAAGLPNDEETSRFLANDAVRGLVVATRAGLDRRIVLAFYRELGRTLGSAGELVLLAQLASDLGDGQGEVRTGKAGVARGYALYEFAYPIHRLPSYEPLRPSVEKALLLAIARQESEFNSQIVSRAGARGVLQVMPITAKHICRQYKIECNLSRLLNDPAYNTRIASAYVADRRDDFTGSYILTLTGFNAGPGRTRQWLREFGDPRSPKVRPLEWIYRIPFEETRLYVRKVLSNVQVYRARLAEADPLRIDLDLERGRKGSGQQVGSAND